MLFENIYKICTEASVMEAILNKVLIPQNGLSQERLSISLTNNFLWFLQKIEQKRTSLNDNIVWCKNSRVFKDLSNSGSFFLFSVPTHFVILSTRIFTYFWKIFLTKNWKCFFVKISPLKNFINIIRDITCNELLTTLVNLCDKGESVYHGYNGPVKKSVLPFPPSYDLVIVTKIRREHFKDRKETDIWTIKCILSCILRESVYLSIQVCSKLHDAIPNG